jgi:hypothetical protein
MPNPVVGSVPRGEDYFGQETLIKSIWDRLKRDNILLAAPRRFGKTAAMYKLLDDPRPEFTPVYTNLEHIKTAGDFMVELISKIYQKRQFKRMINKLWEGGKDIASFFRSLPEDIDIGGFKVKIRENTDVPTHWLMYGERIMNLLAREKPSLLLILDEFAVMIDHIANKNREEVEQLLRWFRSARTAPETRTRFVIGGSIHLIPMLDSMGMVDTVNDLYVQKLKPFTLETAKLYIKEIFASQQMELTDEVRETILELVGEPIPYFLAVLLVEAFENLRATGSKSGLKPGVIKTVFEEDLLGGSASATFYHYRSRIDAYYPGWEGQAAKSILGLLSRVETSVERQTLYSLFLKSTKMSHSTKSEENFMRLMNKLDNDFYITYKEGKYSFFSRVLKLWWKNRYGFQGE